MNPEPQPNPLPPSHHQSTGSGTAVTDSYDFGINHKLGKLCNGAAAVAVDCLCNQVGSSAATAAVFNLP